MSSLDKNKLIELLNMVPYDTETEIILTRSMGDKVIIYNYEISSMKLLDDCLIFNRNGKDWKILYSNIINIKWKPLFPKHKLDFVIDGKFNKKED